MFLERKQVLVFSAHAADFCSRAGGTIARLSDAGARVLCVGRHSENLEILSSLGIETQLLDTWRGNHRHSAEIVIEATGHPEGLNLSGVGSALHPDPYFARGPRVVDGERTPWLHVVDCPFWSFEHGRRTQEAGLGLGERGETLGVRGVGRGCGVRHRRWETEKNDQYDSTYHRH